MMRSASPPVGTTPVGTMRAVATATAAAAIIARWAVVGGRGRDIACQPPISNLEASRGRVHTQQAHLLIGWTPSREECRMVAGECLWEMEGV